MEAHMPRVALSPGSPVRNRKLKQQRPWRARLPSWRQVLAAVGRGVRRAAPTLAGLMVAGAMIAGGLLSHRFVMRSPRFALR
jgi:hypothetical protein